MVEQRHGTIGIWLEWTAWVAFAAGAYALTFKFDEPLDVYRFGASGWPRTVLLAMALGATCQLATRLAGARRDEAEESEEAGGVRLKTLLVFALPLIFLWFLPRTGFFVTTPVFVVALLLLLEVTSWRRIVTVTVVVYAFVLLIFTRFFYVALPVGNWGGFYDANNWIVVMTRSGL